MNTYHIWEKDQNREIDSATIYAGDAEDALIKYSNQCWYDGEQSTHKKWLDGAQEIYCQEERQEKPILFSVRTEVEPVFYVEDV